MYNFACIEFIVVLFQVEVAQRQAESPALEGVGDVLYERESELFGIGSASRNLWADF